ncbi:C25 family cysteine peptidase [Candidatus Bipolaricaulota bacterium]
MKRLLVCTVTVAVMALAAHAGEHLTNDTGETARGLRVVFSEPVELTGFGDSLTSVEPESIFDTFLFSGGEVEPWAGHWIGWAPDSARMIAFEWLASAENLESQASLEPPSEESTNSLCAAFNYEPSYIMRPPSAVCINDACLSEGTAFDYLIVTHPLFLEALEPFIAWKASKGFRVGVATVEWLCQRFQGRHVAERMKTWMHTLRKQAGVVFVLLVGDTTMEDYEFQIDTVLVSYELSLPWNVPTGYNRRTPEDGPGIVRIGDPYFVEDRDWDRDGIGKTELADGVGDWSTQGTLDATLFLGRWPVRRVEEIPPIVAKTMSSVPADKVTFVWNATEWGYERPFGCPDEWPSPNNPLDPPRPLLRWRGTPESKYFYYYGCYHNVSFYPRMILEEATPWITVEAMPVDITNPDETGAMFERLSANKDALVIQTHGARPCIQLAEGTCSEADDLAFENTFSLLNVAACYVAYFYAGDEDSFTEQLLKGERGPAVVAQVPNEYMFWMGLRAGLPVGEAFWRSGATWIDYSAPTILLGDPSLIVIKQP